MGTAPNGGRVPVRDVSSVPCGIRHRTLQTNCPRTVFRLLRARFSSALCLVFTLYPPRAVFSSRTEQMNPLNMTFRPLHASARSGRSEKIGHGAIEKPARSG